MTGAEISSQQQDAIERPLECRLPEGLLFMWQKEMVLTIRKATAIVVGVTFFVGQVGCAQSLYLSEDIRTRLGTIGVVSGRFAPEVELYLPAKGAGGGAGRGAALGAGRSVKYGTVGGCSMGGSGIAFFCSLGLALGLALAVPGALVGGVYGAIAAEPAEKVEDVEATIRQVLAELKMRFPRHHVSGQPRRPTRPPDT